MDRPFCCICNSRFQNCRNCRCRKANRSCRGCRKGDACQNPLGNQRPPRADGADALPQHDNEQPRNLTQPLPVDDPPEQGRPDGGLNNDRRRDEEDNEDAHMEQAIPRDRQENEAERDQAEHDEIANRQQADQQITWMGMEGEVAERWVNETYQGVVNWSSKNVFTPPVCSATKDFANETACMINNYNFESPLKPIALEIAHIMPFLCLQKTHEKAKRSENVAAISRRMAMWRRGEVKELFSEAKALQARTRDNPNRPNCTEDSVIKCALEGCLKQRGP